MDYEEFYKSSGFYENDRTNDPEFMELYTIYMTNMIKDLICKVVSLPVEVKLGSIMNTNPNFLRIGWRVIITSESESLSNQIVSINEFVNKIKNVLPETLETVILTSS